MRYTFAAILFFFLGNSFPVLLAQAAQTYTTEKGEVHLVGPHDCAALRAAPYGEWYAENAEATILPEEIPDWSGELDDVKVKIYLGTWCGDSKTWVPRFLTLWKALGHSEDQLELISLYGRGDQYKQGPGGEGAADHIHRVPTFIFERSGEEFARIVERPRTNLASDVAQIALGYPAAPRYAAANYLLEQFEQQPIDSINANLKTHFQAIRREFSSSSELNTLGYVLKAAGRDKEALLVFYINSFVFRHEPNIIDSYAEMLLATGEEAAALARYERVLEMTPDDERVAGIVAELREKVSEEGKE